jgi:hypothetical protein
MAIARYGSAAFLQRHDIDLLEPFEGLDTGPANPQELATMLAQAREGIPGVLVSEQTALRVLNINPDSFFAIRRFGQIIGGVSYLFLTEDGLDRLILDELDFSNPDPEVLTPPGREPAAIYIWACAAKGRAAAGLGTPCWRLRHWPYGRADYYAQPNTAEGVRFVQQLGFERTPSFQRDLWTFRRRCNRLRDKPSVSQAASIRQAA